MATDYFMYIESAKGPINGESNDADFKDHIQVISYEMGISGPDLDADKGAEAGQPSFPDVKVVIPTSIATAPLFAVAASGELLKTVTIIGRKAGGKQIAFLQWRMHKVQVSSIAHTPNEALATETLMFKHAKVEVCYFRQNQDGTMESAGRQAGWDCDLNKALTPTLPYDPKKKP